MTMMMMMMMMMMLQSKQRHYNKQKQFRDITEYDITKKENTIKNRKQ